MAAMGVYDQIKTAFQDIIAPELHALRGDIRLLDQKVVGLDQKIDSVDQTLSQKIDAVDQKLVQKIDAVDQKLTQKIDAVDQKLTQKIDSLDTRLTVRLDALRSETVSMKAERLAEIRRVDTRIDGVDRELRTAIDIRERLATLEARRPS